MSLDGSTASPPWIDSNNQHLGYLRKTDVWRRVGAVHVGSARVSEAGRRHDPHGRRVGSAMRCSCKCSLGAIRLRNGEPRPDKTPTEARHAPRFSEVG